MIAPFIVSALLLSTLVLVIVWMVFDEDRALVGVIACLAGIAGFVLGLVVSTGGIA